MKYKKYLEGEAAEFEKLYDKYKKSMYSTKSRPNIWIFMSFISSDNRPITHLFVPEPLLPLPFVDYMFFWYNLFTNFLQTNGQAIDNGAV